MTPVSQSCMRVKSGPSFKVGRTRKNAHSEHLLYACHFPYDASLQPLEVLHLHFAENEAGVAVTEGFY